MVNRQAAEALIQEQLIQTIQQDVPKQSIFMSLARKPPTAVTTQTVTFTIKDNEDSPAAIEGAVVDINGAHLKTNASGVAVFSLRAGDYTAPTV